MIVKIKMLEARKDAVVRVLILLTIAALLVGAVVAWLLKDIGAGIFLPFLALTLWLSAYPPKWWQAFIDEE